MSADGMREDGALGLSASAAVSDAVERYCTVALEAALSRTVRAHPTGERLAYADRRAAFARLDDTELLLRRIAETIELIEGGLVEGGARSVELFQDAGRWFLAALSRLSVAGPEGGVGADSIAGANSAPHSAGVSRLSIDGLPVYAAADVPAGCYGYALALLDEVKRAFPTYAKHVRTNGLFGAFLEEGPYGQRAAIRYRGQAFEFDVATPPHPGGAASPVDNWDDATVSKVLSDLAALNDAPYEGVFEEDPRRRVELFWRGLDILGYGVGACGIDAGPFSKWCEDVFECLRMRAGKLAEGMPWDQACAYRRAVLELASSFEAEAAKDV